MKKLFNILTTIVMFKERNMDMGGSKTPEKPETSEQETLEQKEKSIPDSLDRKGREIGGEEIKKLIIDVSFPIKILTLKINKKEKTVKVKTEESLKVWEGKYCEQLSRILELEKNSGWKIEIKTSIYGSISSCLDATGDNAEKKLKKDVEESEKIDEKIGIGGENPHKFLR